MSGKAKGQVKATVIKAADPVISAPIKKSDAPSQVTVEEAVNAGDWIDRKSTRLNSSHRL